MKVAPVLFGVLFTYVLFAQQPDSVQSDTTRILDEVVIRAFHYNRALFEVPASVGFIDTVLLRYGVESDIIVPINSMPGVRMEERSPGSYRLSIRGSTLRSPFGVRNVKIYWNAAPLTDAGGNTYLNMIDAAMLGTVEVIKGPASSLYGAGTGGVVLFSSPSVDLGTTIEATLQGGSYGQARWNASVSHNAKATSQQVQFLHQQSDGFRDHTRMARDNINAVLGFGLPESKHRVKAYMLFSDLFYQTPGALTLSEFNEDPRMSRPATATLPSAVEQRAAVYLQSIFGSVVHDFEMGKNMSSETSLFANQVDFKNLSLRNIEIRDETTWGIRTTIQVEKNAGNVRRVFVIGGELQDGNLPVKTFENNSGNRGAVLTNDNTDIFQYSTFAQAELKLDRFSMTAGLSVNGMTYNFDRSIGQGIGKNELNLDLAIMPRVAVLMKLSERLVLHASASRGFSPPTLAEVISSTGELNTNLKAESGLNLEIGGRFNVSPQVYLEMTAYRLSLSDAIVLRRAQDGAEYFVNAGGINQSGVESSASYKDAHWQVWLSHAFQYFRFTNYIQDQSNYSGNEVTGAPSSMLNGGIGWRGNNRMYFRATFNMTSMLPLDDANTAYAEAYTVLNMKSGYANYWFEIYVGCDNLFNETYSLGNDTNAFGGRYFNTAPGRSIYAGLKLNFHRW